jgi:predicted ester cyclase
MSDDNKAVVRRLYEEVFQAGNLDIADELVDPDCRDHADTQDRRGPERAKEVAAMLKEAFPDARWEIAELIGEGDRVAMHLVFSGTHRGPFMGMEPTGRSFSDVHHIYLFRLREGKVTEYRAVRDDMGMMRQLGAMR